jgi:hypothetical protein
MERHLFQPDDRHRPFLSRYLALVHHDLLPESIDRKRDADNQ